jgi:lysozyme
MKTNEEGINLIKRYEGCELESYQDEKGIWTIGYGHTGAEIIEGMKISINQADKMFLNDLLSFENGVTKLLVPNINENMFSALVSFSYNCGLGALRTSTLLKLINETKYFEAANEFLKWNKIAGKVDHGLTNRRRSERELFLKAESNNDLPLHWTPLAGSIIAMTAIGQFVI